MRYSSALVLGALAAGQASAHSIRHAGFHARRHVESKRDLADVNWKDVTYDLSDISEAEWSSILATPAAATSAPAPSSAAPAPAVTSAAKAEVAAVTSKAAASPTSEKPAATTTASSDDSDDSGVSDTFSDLFSGLTSFVESLGAKIGVNSQQSCDTAWLGDDSNWKMNIRNQLSESIYVFCWGPEGSWVNDKTPAISIRLAAGEKQTISFAEGFSGACSHAGAGFDSLVNGQIANTWAEFTFKPTWGVFDVSREPKASGTSISMQGTQCLSDMETCVFKCKDGDDSCTFGYTLHNCDQSNGGGKGVDYGGNGGDSGGCMMGADGETIDMTFG